MRAQGVGLKVLIAAGVGSVLAYASHARADEPVAASEPRLMSETAEVTSVVDAFDKDDPFDLHLLLGFSQQWKNANIRRETALFQPGLTTGGFVARTENIAKYNQSLSMLNVGADIGIFRDFALVTHVDDVIVIARAKDHWLLVAQTEESIAMIVPILLPHGNETVGNGDSHIIEWGTSRDPRHAFEKRSDLCHIAGYAWKSRVGFLLPIYHEWQQ